jgi:hypothetical protein
MEVSSIFTVTNIKTKVRERVEIEGSGEESIKVLRAAFPKLSRIVLNGFKINGEIKQLKL